MSRFQRTYQTRFGVTLAEDTILSRYAALFGKAERSLFAKLQAGQRLSTLKREHLRSFGLTARQFNSLASILRGKIQSIKNRRAGLIKDLEQRITKATRAITKITNASTRHQKQRRLSILQNRLAKLRADHASGTVRLCFGGKKAFRAQFALKENGYASHAEWREAWRTSRNSQFFVIGAKDETAGCQSCVATVSEDGSITLRLRLPDALSAHGKHLILSGLRFPYGHDAIVSAIGRNLSAHREDWQPIHYRFLKDQDGWRVFVTVVAPEVPVISHPDIGVIGLDINADSLAVTETDRFGNPIEYVTVPCVTYGKSTGQRRAVIGEAIKQVVAFARSRGKPIAVERMDFSKMRAALEGRGVRYARMLSSFAYTQIQALLRARAVDAGIAVQEVNPAYTSVMGRYTFRNRYGMSEHHAAALAIGRRAMGLRETLPRQLRVTLSLSVRNRGRHVWSQWAVVSRWDRAAPAAHRRPGRQFGSSPSPVCDKARCVTMPPVAGGIPACESSSTPFG